MFDLTKIYKWLGFFLAVSSWDTSSTASCRIISLILLRRRKQNVQLCNDLTFFLCNDLCNEFNDLDIYLWPPERLWQISSARMANMLLSAEGNSLTLILLSTLDITLRKLSCPQSDSVIITDDNIWYQINSGQNTIYEFHPMTPGEGLFPS